MKTETVSARLSPETAKKFSLLAKAINRSKSYLAAEAIEAYVNDQQWQIDAIAAREMVRRVWEAAKLLAEHPDAGKAGRVPGTRELIIGGTPLILPYRVKGNTVQILRVLH
jgi:predicted transcriptional regulator